MRFDFNTDKRLMSGEQGSTGDKGFDNQVQALEQSAGDAKSPEQARIIRETIQTLKARKTATDKGTAIVGSSAADAAAGVQKKASETTVENAGNTARAIMEQQAKASDSLRGLLEKSANGLLDAKLSIEQMKAGFSGMLQMAGIIAKHLGAEDFGDSCLELATKLNPQLVVPDAQAQAAIENFKNNVRLDPSLGQAAIDGSVASSANVISQTQGVVTKSVGDGIDSVGRIKQPTAFDTPQVTGSDARPAAASSTGAVGTFDAMMNKLMTAKEPILLGSESTVLHRDFVKFAGQEGNKAAIDSQTEIASMTASIRMNVQNPEAEKKLIASLTAPRPGAGQGF